DFAIGNQLIDHYAVNASSPQTAGTAFTTTVTAQDVLNATVTGDSSTVVTMTSSGSAQFDSNGDSTFGDNTKTVSSGAFTISTTDNVAQDVTLTVTDPNSKTGTSSSITVNPATATQLAFSTQPGSATYGSALSPQPVVKTRDAYGNDSTVGIGASKTVTLTLSAGTGSLQGTASLDIGTGAGDGTVTFSGLTVSSAGSGKQLTVSATG